jgi:hypothetical protein
MSIFTPASTGTSAPFTSPPPTLSPGDLTILNGTPGATSSTGVLPVVFCIRAGPGRFAPILTLVSKGTASTVTATLQVSFDGGATWEVYGTSSALNLLISNQIQIEPGPLYQVNLTTVTGGTALVTAGVS